MNQIEALRFQTGLLIEMFPALDPDGTNLTIFRPTALVSDGAGGLVPAGGAPTTLQDRQRYLGKVYDAAVLEPALVPEIGGHFALTFVLIGTLDDDIRVRDYFQMDGYTHVVVAVDPDKRFQCKCTCGRQIPHQVVTEEIV